MLRAPLLALGLCLGLLVGAPSAGAEPRFVYPLKYPPRVSSSFGTYRIGHHHAGMDLTTDGDPTVPVIAAADGEVVRIQRNDRGFGRAVYIAHPGGWVTVYAHLSGFAPALLPAVRAAERDDFRFKVYQRPPIPVKRGDVLGWIGSSGTDLVHLHFETRRENTPVNPLTHGMPLPDAQPPVIRRLLAVPRAPGSHVDGRLDERMYRFGADGALEGGPVLARGDVRLMVEAVDFIDGMSRAVTPYMVALYIDGRLWHRSVYDEASYLEKGHTELDYHPRLRAEGEGMFHTLVGGPGPRVRAHRKVGRRLSRLKDGRYPARIEVRDAAGNTAEARFELVIGPARPCETRRRGLGKPRKAVDAVQAGLTPLLRDRMLAIPIPELCDGPYDVRVDGERSRDAVPNRIGDQPALALTVPGDAPATVEVGIKAEGRTVWRRVTTIAGPTDTPIEADPIWLELGRESRFWNHPTLFLGTFEHDGAPGLEPVTPLYRLANGWVPTKAGSTLGLAVPKTPSGSALYFHERGRYWWMGRTRRGRFLRGWTVHFGEVAVLRDTEPPQIGVPRIESHPAGYRLIVPVHDEGSGLRHVRLRVDGQAVRFERQRGWSRVVWLPLDRPAPGPHHLEVEVEDRIGQVERLATTIEWPGPRRIPPRGGKAGEAATDAGAAKNAATADRADGGAASDGGPDRAADAAAATPDGAPSSERSLSPDGGG